MCLCLGSEDIPLFNILSYLSRINTLMKTEGQFFLLLPNTCCFPGNKWKRMPMNASSGETVLAERFGGGRTNCFLPKLQTYFLPV